MQRGILKLAVSAIAVVALGVLAGCGSLSRNITDGGNSAGQLVWPDPANTIAIHRGGTFPHATDLHQVQAGLNKQQITALIGPPHFDEGFVGVREWNYLFNFRRGSGATTQCEYKILFDTHLVARSFYWNPGSCADFQKTAVAMNSASR